jgi:ABC-type arginine transport system permease subunit
MIEGYLPLLMTGATVSITVAASTLGQGALVGWGLLAGPRLLRRGTELYTTLARGVPGLILIQLIHYRLPQLPQQGLGGLTLILPPFATGVATPGLKAYFNEIVFLFHATSPVSLLIVPDVTGGACVYQFYETYLVATCVYLAIAIVIVQAGWGWSAGCPPILACKGPSLRRA